MEDAGGNRQNCWVTNVCKYEVPPNAKGKKIPFADRVKSVGIDMQQQIVELQEEISALKPNLILDLEALLFGH